MRSKLIKYGILGIQKMNLHSSNIPVAKSNKNLIGIFIENANVVANFFIIKLMAIGIMKHHQNFGMVFETRYTCTKNTTTNTRLLT